MVELSSTKVGQSLVNEQLSFTLGDVEYSVRMTLRLWLELEEQNKKIIQFMKGKSMLDASAAICSYLSIYTKIDIDTLKTYFWLDIADAYITIFLACIPKMDFPLLHGKTDNQSPISWDYEGRTWYTWSHLLASKYSWSLETIENLYFEDGIAYIQEILIDDQLEKEWQWSLSELSYSYNKATNKSEFKSLPRPSWMTRLTKMKEPEVVKMPVSMMPVGNVIRWKQNEETLH
jgi:hypothetical protein